MVVKGEFRQPPDRLSGLQMLDFQLLLGRADRGVGALEDRYP